MTVSVLFVCLGNICRSPTAEGVFRAKVNAHEQLTSANIKIDSAGTAAWHRGKSPDERSQAAAKKRGYDLSPLRARQVEPADFARFDYIFAMDLDNLALLREQAARTEFSGHLGLFLQLIDGVEREVPDPYYGAADGFDRVLNLVEAASDALIDIIVHQHSNNQNCNK